MESVVDHAADVNFLGLVFSSGAGDNSTHADFRVLQFVWDLRLGYEWYISSPLFPILLSMSFFFACCVPWMCIDLFGRDWHWIQKYKIYPDKPSEWPAIRKAMMLTLWNHLIYLLPISLAQWVWTPATFLPDQAPTLWQFAWHIVASLLVFDFEYWALHILFHKNRFLYRHVHAVHHEYYLSNVWVTQYLHPWELVCVGVFTTTSPWLFTDHPMTHWSFMLFSITVSVDDHIGYDLPFLPHHWLPLWGGSIKHDMHHQKPLTNFEPFFNFWDRLFGFECPGVLAGGVKSHKLLKWEEDRREQFKKKRQQRATASATPPSQS